MPIIKVTFTNNDDATAILENGVFISHQFLLPVKYRPQIQPTRCYKCNRYGHTAKLCKNEITCAKCSNKHPTKECDSQIKKCINCGSDHYCFDKSCPKYKELFLALNHFL